VTQQTSLARVALNFNLTAIPTNATVSKAELSFNRIGDYLGYDMAGTYKVYLITKSWTSATATWDNLSTSIGTTAVATKSYTTGTKGWITFDVTSATKSLVANPSNNYGFMILIDFVLNSSTNGHISKIHSSESKSTQLQPKIVIDYTTGTAVTNHTALTRDKLAVSYSRKGNLLVSIPQRGNYTISFYAGNGSMLGKIDNTCFDAGTHTLPCADQNLPKGVLFVMVKNDDMAGVSRVVVY